MGENRTPLETVAFAAWVNCAPDAIPPEYRQHTCEATMIAWRRVVAAVTEALAASPEVAKLVAEAEARGMERAAARARVYASSYAQSSDGRNTFILLAEWADAEAAAIRREATK